MPNSFHTAEHDNVGTNLCNSLADEIRLVRDRNYRRLGTRPTLTKANKSKDESHSSMRTFNMLFTVRSTNPILMVRLCIGITGTIYGQKNVALVGEARTELGEEAPFPHISSIDGHINADSYKRIVDQPM